MRLLAVVALLALTLPLHAQDDPVKNAEVLLEAQKELKKEVLSEVRYIMSMQGMRIGSGEIKISEGKCEDMPCYLMHARLEMRFGQNGTEMVSTSYITADLRTLSEISTKKDLASGDIETDTLTLTKDGYISTNAKDSKLTRKSYEARKRLLVGSADHIAVLLASAQPGKSFSFLGWSTDLDFHEETMAVVGPTERGELKGTRVDWTKRRMSGEETGKKRVEVSTDEFLIDDKMRVVRIAAGSVPAVVELDLGRFAREEVEKLANPIDPVLAFWIAVRDKDAKLLAAAMNERKYFDYIKRDDAEWQKKDEATKDIARTMFEREAASKMVEKGASERFKLLVDGLSTTWFTVKMDGDDKGRIEFSEHFRKETGDKSTMAWNVEKNKETGKWEFTTLETDDDDF